MAFTLFLYAREYQSDVFLISLHFCYFVLFFFRMLSRVVTSRKVPTPLIRKKVKVTPCLTLFSTCLKRADLIADSLAAYLHFNAG